MSHLGGIPDSGTRASGQIERELASALRLQRLLAEISTRFVTRPAGRMDDTIEETQHLICEILGLDRSTLWQISGDGAEMILTHFWQPAGEIPLRRNFITTDNLPWAEGKIRRGEAFHFSSLDDLPPEAAVDLHTLRVHGTRSNATFPLVADGIVFGALAFARTHAERQWTEDELSGLGLIAQIFGQVISRRRSEERAEQLREEIQRSTRAAELGEIAATLAHEINQPLTTILGNAQAARRFLDKKTASPAEMRAILDDIIRDDKRAGEIVHNLREMLNGTPARRESTCLNAIIRETAGFLQTEMAGQAVDLQLDLEPTLPTVRVAQVEIQQLLINLISNAARAMCETPPQQRRIIIETRQRGRMIHLRVRDHGCGIPAKHIDRIFEPFHSTRSKGLGMGLAICRRIAESHGGRIIAENTATGGARFTLSLPCGSKHLEK